MSERELIDTSVQAVTLSEGRVRFIADFVQPHFTYEVTFRDLMAFSNLVGCLRGRVIRGLFEEVVETTENRVSTKQGKRLEVKVYMVDKKAREVFKKVGNVLSDLAKINDTIILPESEEEMSCLVSIVAKTLKTGEPMTFYTPVCPDWSRDKEGQYDFKSLGGGESYIANKFFVYSPEFLEIFQRNGVLYRGIILFADWGLEAEIDAKDTYGQKLSPDDVRMCFASTLAATDQTLKHLQDDVRLGPLFANYEVMSMKEFLGQRIDEQRVMVEMRQFFTTDKQGSRLLEILDRDSLKLNRQRLGVGEGKNRELAIQNLVEYSTVGQAIGDDSFLVVCESPTTSRCYNSPRAKDKKVPVFFVKGKERLRSGVNIL